MTRRRVIAVIVLAAVAAGAIGWWLEDWRLLAGSGGVLLLLLVTGILVWRRKRRRPRRRGPRRAPIPVEVRRRVYARDGRRCRYCGRQGRGVRLELDHVHPVARGGGDEMGNLVTACLECNRAKGATILGNERAMARFVAERMDAADAMSRAARRRAFLRNVVAPAVVFGVVVVIYLVLTRFVW